jgi:hypothetical protein
MEKKKKNKEGDLGAKKKLNIHPIFGDENP